ncbi:MULTISPECIES: TerC family protein [unclassified Polynucleobacter]|jgi:YjbE family integral membrane protein|uniref:TerC family protein n=1 Tax=unclassified Polynucleobacter TaxID=2640945 RepID=UPI001BFD2821|nr:MULTISPECIES: TerC family protein [unclassified Polynucleobacter]MBU3637954.1 TerC family protein [Polynucleobacter sp. AP-RePozz3-80-G7]MEA9600714.1 TerC family protein [Polynucleobacter sp. MG-28-Ekke-A2]MEA9603202.1 TerC family protein [Polynucleobacter sp. JS-JIR-II-c23]QWD81364.1 TerC family protein [Polynucleobacter sp. MWH-S4W17]QWE02312.1 TerC family protein [Polynucleobacter sp. JS-JIR-II-b4]
MDFSVFSGPAFWAALLSIIVANILLSGDNAVVIALASRNLPANQQKKAIFWGSAAAIILRVILTITAVQLLSLPYLKIVGAILLVYIGVQLLADSDDEAEMDGHSNIWGAIRTILVADLVMSLDNVIAVAAAAQKGPEETRLALLIIGLGLSIPLIIFGSTMLLKVMDRFPVIITLGAGLLGLLAGGMLVEDPAIKDSIQGAMEDAHMIFEGIGVAIVILLGTYLKKKNRAKA